MCFCVHTVVGGGVEGVFGGKEEMNHHGRIRVIVPAGSKVRAESEGTKWFVVNRPPFSALSQPLSPHPSASSPAMIRNHNLMLHCHTVSTSILRGELNDPFVRPRLRGATPHAPQESEDCGSNHLCRLIVESPPPLIFLWHVNQTGVVDLLLTLRFCGFDASSAPGLVRVSADDFFDVTSQAPPRGEYVSINNGITGW